MSTVEARPNNTDGPEQKDYSDYDDFQLKADNQLWATNVNTGNQEHISWQIIEDHWQPRLSPISREEFNKNPELYNLKIKNAQLEDQLEFANFKMAEYAALAAAWRLASDQDRQRVEALERRIEALEIGKSHSYNKDDPVKVRFGDRLEDGWVVVQDHAGLTAKGELMRVKKAGMDDDESQAVLRDNVEPDTVRAGILNNTPPLPPPGTAPPNATWDTAPAGARSPDNPPSPNGNAGTIPPHATPSATRIPARRRNRVTGRGRTTTTDSWWSRPGGGSDWIRGRRRYTSYTIVDGKRIPVPLEVDEHGNEIYDFEETNRLAAIAAGVGLLAVGTLIGYLIANKTGHTVTIKNPDNSAAINELKNQFNERMNSLSQRVAKQKTVIENQKLLSWLKRHELREAARVSSANFHPRSIYGETPHQVVRNMFDVIRDNNIRIRGETHHKVTQIVQAMMNRHWHIASGVDVNHNQHIVDVASDWADGRTGNADASALQGMRRVGGSSVSNWHRFMHLAMQHGIRFSRNT